MLGPLDTVEQHFEPGRGKVAAGLDLQRRATPVRIDTFDGEAGLARAIPFVGPLRLAFSRARVQTVGWIEAFDNTLLFVAVTDDPARDGCIDHSTRARGAAGARHPPEPLLTPSQPITASAAAHAIVEQSCFFISCPPSRLGLAVGSSESYQFRRSTRGFLLGRCRICGGERTRCRRRLGQATKVTRSAT